MATIGDVLRALLHGDRISPENLAELEQAVTDFERDLHVLDQRELDVPAAAPVPMRVPVVIDAQGNVTQG